MSTRPTIAPSARPLGWIFLVGFLLTIPLANWTLHRYGFVHVPWLGPVAAGVFWVGISFVLRDLAQLILGRLWAIAAIAAGTALSYWVASPAIAYASGAAFLCSEMMDMVIYTPLADSGRFTLGVLLSGYAGAFVDSTLFLWIAFGSIHGWWQLAVVKIVILMVATPFAKLARDRVVERASTPAVA